MQPLDLIHTPGPLQASGWLNRSEAEQDRAGYVHTLREIRQQPATIRATVPVLARTPGLNRLISDARLVVLTGSGSSEYVGDSVRNALQSRLGVPVEVVPGGSILTNGAAVVPPLRPALMISIARSGDSPESTAALRLVLDQEPEVRHLVITCNPNGALSTDFQDDPRVSILTLDPRTNDRSLVMTSSFTALATAARGLGYLGDLDTYSRICDRCSDTVNYLLSGHIARFEELGSLAFTRVVYLGTADNFGAARECALKMLEMTAGRVSTMAETYLGLRHGPMSFVNDQTLVVCFLSSNPVARAYELDLIDELNRKQLGLAKVIIGENVPAGLVASRDNIPIECAHLAQLGDENASTAYVVCGQLLGLFRSLREGLRPDSPSENGIISRVVESFRLHGVGELRS
ncbi:MAG: SIS domain-containing protein [Acidobacteriaceae bacterium]|nr:SIS domain-containing protein [Acidobacteriaceae bacterium]